MEENQDTDKSDLEPSIKQSKSTRKQLKESLAQIDKLLNFKSMKSAKLADLAIERSGLIKLLLQIEHDEKADKNFAELATTTAQLTEANAEIVRLKHELQSRATQRVQPQALETDDRVSASQEQVRTLEELIKSVATLARSCDIESRTRHAVSLVIKYGKQVFPVVEGIGVDFSSVAVALQKSETELLGLLQQAQQEGPALPVYRAVLSVRDAIQVDARGKRQYPDQFQALESDLYVEDL